MGPWVSGSFCPGVSAWLGFLSLWLLFVSGSIDYWVLWVYGSFGRWANVSLHP